MLSPARKFINKNLSTKDDFGQVKEGRTEAQRVDKELERLNNDAVDIGKSLDKLKENSQLKPPSFSDVSNKQVLVGSTSAGAAIGGAMGILSNTVGGSGSSVTFTDQVVAIQEQSLQGTGFDMKYYTVGGTPSNPEGYDIENFTQKPLLQEKVGEYTKTTPNIQSSGNILVSGLVGAGIGAGAGAVIGGLTILGRKALKAEYSGAAPRKTEGDNKLLVAGGIAGAAVGGVAGGLSHMVNTRTVSYTTESIPTMETKVLGQMPSGPKAYVPASEFKGHPTTEQVAKLVDTSTRKLTRKGIENAENLSPRDITGQVPQKNLIGRVKVDTEKKEINVGPGLLTSVVGGMAVGAITGVAGGVLVNVLRKTL